MSRRRRIQISLNALMMLTLVAAFLFVDGHWSTIILIEVLASWIAIVVLVRNRPRSIRDQQYANCVRLDGSWSTGRERAEMHSVRRVHMELVKAVLLVLAASNVVLLVIDSEVIPISLASDVMLKIRPAKEEWKANTRDEQSRFDSWLGASTTGEKRMARKRKLANAWPLIALGGIAGCGASVVYITYVYFDALKHLRNSVRYRARQYELLELHRTTRDGEYTDEIPTPC